MSADDELAAALARARVPRGRLRAALGPALDATTSTSTASRRGPSCSGRSASASRRAVAEHEPDAVRLAGPELGAVALAAAASLASGLPFLIVRKEAKEYGTANRLEGVFEQGERVCLVEDVVTSGGAAVEAVRGPAGGRSRVPNRGLRGRSRGGRSGRSRAPRRPSVPLFRAGRLAPDAENCRKTAWLSRNSVAVRLDCAVRHRQRGGG